MSNEYRGRPIREWLEAIAEGHIALPLFQRSYVWDHKKTADLLYALLVGRPTGTLLLIDFQDDEGAERFTARPVRGQTDSLESCKELILDGQQRLTSLYHALCNDFYGHKPDHEYFIQVDDIEKDHPEIMDVVSQKKRQGGASKSPEDLIRENRIPVWILGVDDVTQESNASFSWCSRAKENDANEAHRLDQKIQKHFGESIRNLNLYFAKLPNDMSREDAIEVFIKTNESSAIIKRFDIAVAQISEEEGNDLRNNIFVWAEQAPAINRFFDQEEERQVSEVGELILKVACLLTGNVPTDKYYTSNSVINLLRSEDGFQKIRRGIEWAFEILEEERIYNGKHLPSTVPLRVLPPLHEDFEKLQNEDKKGRARRLSKSYLWRAFLTERYLRSANTRLKVDYDALKKNFQAIDSGEDIVRDAPIFEEETPDAEVLSSLEEPLKSPTTRDRLARAMLCLTFKKGAMDFSSGETISVRNAAGREAHHLFPKGFLKGTEMEDRKYQNHALNYALVNAPTNRSLAAKPPLRYLMDRYVSDPDLSEDELRTRVESHLIPFDALSEVTRASRKGVRGISRSTRKIAHEGHQKID